MNGSAQPGPGQAGRSTRTRLRGDLRGRRGAGFVASGLAIPVVLLGAALVASAAHANGERDGRWWWEARAAYGQRSVDTRVGNAGSNAFDQSEAGVSFGVNGVIVHPEVVRFRVQVDLLRNRYADGRAIDSDRVGLGADFRAFPSGAVPFTLYFRDNGYDYGGADALGQIGRVGTPEGVRQWGGQMRVTRGPLVGLQAGVQATEVDFTIPGVDDEQNDRQWATLVKRSRRFQYHVRAERRKIDYGRIDSATEDVLLRYDQRGRIDPTLTWDFNTDLIRRDSRSGVRFVNTDDYRMRNRVQKRIGDEHIFDAFLRLGQRASTGVDTVDSAEAIVRERWIANPAWEVGPFAAYGWQASSDRSFDSPRVGLSATWRRPGPVGVILTGSGSWGDTRLEDEAGTRRDGIVTYGLVGSLNRRWAGGFRGNLEFSGTRNDLSFDQDRVDELPDLGLSTPVGAVRDTYRMRAGVHHSWDSQTTAAWFEWSRATDDRDLDAGYSSRTRYATGLDWNRANWTVRGNIGNIDVVHLNGVEEQLQTASARLVWRSRGWLRVYGSYSRDLRRSRILSDSDRDWLEAGTVVDLGNLRVDVRAFRRATSTTFGDDREDRGLEWRVSTRFAGWLPIVTGTKRRGVIR